MGLNSRVCEGLGVLILIVVIVCCSDGVDFVRNDESILIAIVGGFVDYFGIIEH